MELERPECLTPWSCMPVRSRMRSSASRCANTMRRPRIISHGLDLSETTGDVDYSVSEVFPKRDCRYIKNSRARRQQGAVRAWGSTSTPSPNGDEKSERIQPYNGLIPTTQSPEHIIASLPATPSPYAQLQITVTQRIMMATPARGHRSQRSLGEPRPQTVAVNRFLHNNNIATGRELRRLDTMPLLPGILRRPHTDPGTARYSKMENTRSPHDSTFNMSEIPGSQTSDARNNIRFLSTGQSVPITSAEHRVIKRKLAKSCSSSSHGDLIKQLTKQSMRRYERTILNPSSAILQIE